MFADFCFQSGEGSIMPDDSCVSHFLLINIGCKESLQIISEHFDEDLTWNWARVFLRSWPVFKQLGIMETLITKYSNVNYVIMYTKKLCASDWLIKNAFFM